VGSSGDPHRLSWAMPGGVRQPRNEIAAMKSILGDIYPPDETTVKERHSFASVA
jgi:hypothetical protein